MRLEQLNYRKLIIKKAQSIANLVANRILPVFDDWFAPASHIGWNSTRSKYWITKNPVTMLQSLSFDLEHVVSTQDPNYCPNGTQAPPRISRKIIEVLSPASVDYSTHSYSTEGPIIIYLAGNPLPTEAKRKGQSTTPKTYRYYWKIAPNRYRIWKPLCKAR